MTWYKILAPDDELERIIQIYCDRYFQAGHPEQASLFTSDSFTNGLYSIFFPPAALPLAQDIIARYSGTPCDPPPSEGTGLECGDEKDFDLLS
jgi:hypothetical protein